MRTTWIGSKTEHNSTGGPPYSLVHCKRSSVVRRQEHKQSHFEGVDRRTPQDWLFSYQRQRRLFMTGSQRSNLRDCKTSPMERTPWLEHDLVRLSLGATEDVSVDASLHSKEKHRIYATRQENHETPTRTLRDPSQPARSFLSQVGQLVRIFFGTVIEPSPTTAEKW